MQTSSELALCHKIYLFRIPNRSIVLTRHLIYRALELRGHTINSRTILSKFVHKNKRFRNKRNKFASISFGLGSDIPFELIFFHFYNR